MTKRPREPVLDLTSDRLSLQTVRAAAKDCRSCAVHPPSLLRAPDDETRRRETQRFIQDLRSVAKRL